MGLRKGWRRLTGPRGRDVVIVTLCALNTILQMGWFTLHDQSVVWVVLAGLLGTAITVAMWWRRRFPLLVTAIAGPAALIGGIFAPIWFAVVTVAVRRRDRVLAVVMLYAAIMLGAPSGQGDWTLSSMIAGAVVVALAAAIGAYIGARRDLLDSLRDRALRAEAERELRADQARRAERARIAREMHDVLAHKVSLIALQAGALEVNPAQDPAQVEQTAGLIRATARATLEDLRDVLGVLRSDAEPGVALAPQPGLADLPRLIGDSRAAGVQVELTVADGMVLPDTLGRTVYRIVQEALTNVHKHARGARTEVWVIPAGPDLEVGVRNVRPLAVGSLLPGAGAGLTGLTERVELTGGTLTAGPTRDGGFEVRALLPRPVTVAR